MPISGAPVYAFGPFRLEPVERCLLLGDAPIPLAPKVFDLLVLLVEADGRLVPKELLMQRLWPDTVVEEVNLARNVSLLRKALGETEAIGYIETVPKSGYRFTAPITRIATPPPPPPRRIPRGIAAGTVAAVGVAGILAWRGTYEIPADSSPSHEHYVRATFDGNVIESSLSPDGTQVASIVGRRPMRLVVRDTATGSSIELLRGEFLYHPKWSPDGSAVAAAFLPETGQNGFFAVVPRLGGQPLKLARGFGNWAPDGTRVVKARTNPRGFQVLGLDNVLVKEVSVGGFVWLVDLEWSRATDRVLLWTEDDRHHSILWSASPDGADVKQVYAPGAQLLGATWTADGSAVYALKPIAESADLVRVPVDPQAGGEQVLVRGLTAARGLSLSADGSKLLFRRVTRAANLVRITIEELETGQVKSEPLTRGASRLLSPAIAPDGQRIAFVRADGDAGVIHTGSLPLDAPSAAITAAALNAESPAWSPDGSRIAFAAARPEGDRLWIVKLTDGSQQEIRTARMIAREADAVAWAPDGRLVYQTSDHHSYYLLDPATGKELRLGSTDAGWMFAPRFSPDGSRVAVYWNRAPSGPALWIIDLRTQAETFVAKGIRPLGWSSGGRAIYGFRALANEPEILRVDPSTGTETLVTRLPASLLESGSVSPDGREIVCSVREETADAWIIENFDPQRTRRSPARRR